AGNIVKGPGMANRITLRAFTGPQGATQLVGFANGKKVVAARDEDGNSLAGRDTSFSIGAKQPARNAIGSFIGLQVAMPDPYQRGARDGGCSPKTVAALPIRSRRASPRLQMQPAGPQNKERMGRLCPGNDRL